MVRQIQIVAILMMVNSGLIAVAGLLVLGWGGFLVATGQTDKSLQQRDKEQITIVGAAAIGGGVLILGLALFQLLAGMRCRRFRSRSLVLTALFCNILMLPACYCAPTSLAMMIYGLIVLFNADVARAFHMKLEGYSPEDILRTFAPAPRYYPRDDYDQRH